MFIVLSGTIVYKDFQLKNQTVEFIRMNPLPQNTNPALDTPASEEAIETAKKEKRRLFRKRQDELDRLTNTSDIIRALPSIIEGDTITLDGLMKALGNRAFGMALLLFSLPSCLPMPPGIPTLCGIMLVVVAIQLTLGLPSVALPSWLGKRTISKDLLSGIADKTAPIIAKLEGMFHPRWPFLTHGIAKQFLGIMVLLLGGVMILPIPLLGNLPPAFAAAILGIALVERDGVLILFGHLAAAAAVIFTAGLALQAGSLVVGLF